MEAFKYAMGLVVLLVAYIYVGFSMYQKKQAGQAYGYVFSTLTFFVLCSLLQLLRIDSNLVTINCLLLGTTFWLLYVIRMTNPSLVIKKRYLFLSFFAPVAFFLMVLTYEYFVWIGLDYELLQKKFPFGLFIYDDICYTIYVVCFYVVLGASLFVITKYRKRISAIFVGQNIMLMVAFGIFLVIQAVLAFVTSLAFELQLLSTLLMLALFYWSIMQQRKRDCLAIAKDAVFEHISCGVLVLGNEGRVIVSNHRASKIFSMPAKLLEGLYYNTFLAGWLKKNNAKVEMNEKGTLIGILIENELAYFQESKSVVLDKNKHKVGSLIEFQEVTSQQKTSEELFRITNYDLLTNMFSARYFMEMCKKMNQPHFFPLAIIAVDVNDVKQINEKFGFAQGDKRIVDVAQVLHEQAPEATIVARNIKNTFLVLIPHTSEAVVQRYIEIVARLCNHTPESKNTDISFGYAMKMSMEEIVGEDIDKNLQETIERAVLSMNQVKKENKPYAFSAPLAKDFLNKSLVKTENGMERVKEQ